MKPFPMEEHLMYSTETPEQDPFPKRWKASSSGTSTQVYFFFTVNTYIWCLSVLLKDYHVFGGVYDVILMVQ